MDRKHSPNTETVKYMLSDLNDHHKMREKFIENNSSKYVSMTVWFNNLSNELNTHVNYSGDILLGYLKCITGSNVDKNELKSVLPSKCNIKYFLDDEKNTKIEIVIHESKNSDPMDPKEYKNLSKSVKQTLLEKGYIEDNY